MKKKRYSDTKFFSNAHIKNIFICLMNSGGSILDKQWYLTKKKDFK